MYGILICPFIVTLPYFNDPFISLCLSHLLPDEDDRDSKSPIIFPSLNHQASEAPEELSPEIPPSRFTTPLPPPIDIETRSPALKKACLQMSNGRHFSMETLRNLRPPEEEKQEAEVLPFMRTPPRRTNGSPPLPAPVLSAVLV